MNASCIIKMTGNTTAITNPNSPNDKPKKFTYDKSYWSHDGYEEKSDGYLKPTNDHYADQVGGMRLFYMLFTLPVEDLENISTRGVWMCMYMGEITDHIMGTRSRAMATWNQQMITMLTR